MSRKASTIRASIIYSDPGRTNLSSDQDPDYRTKIRTTGMYRTKTPDHRTGPIIRPIAVATERENGYRFSIMQFATIFECKNTFLRFFICSIIICCCFKHFSSISSLSMSSKKSPAKHFIRIFILGCFSMFSKCGKGIFISPFFLILTVFLRI